MNPKFQKVISGLERHAGIAEYRCWQDNGDIMPNEYCPYFEENECVAQLTKDAINLLKEYDSALRGMVYQYCTEEHGEKEEFFHYFMSACEEAFKVLGIENGEEVTDEFIWS